jgi:hypothetical protein
MPHATRVAGDLMVDGDVEASSLDDPVEALLLTLGL